MENRKGSLFQKRFKRIAIQNNAKLIYTLAYIHHNPIHHGYTCNFIDWEFSSYRSFTNEKAKSLIEREIVFGWFEENYNEPRKAFFKYHEEFKFEKSDMYEV